MGCEFDVFSQNSVCLCACTEAEGEGRGITVSI